jgi:hypothetical protein
MSKIPDGSQLLAKVEREIEARALLLPETKALLPDIVSIDGVYVDIPATAALLKSQ